MPWIHLFTFKDFRWFPGLFWNPRNNFLQFVWNPSGIGSSWVDLLIEKLKAINSRTVIELASVGGGGLLWLNGEILRQIPERAIILLMTSHGPIMYRLIGNLELKSKIRTRFKA